MFLPEFLFQKHPGDELPPCSSGNNLNYYQVCQKILLFDMNSVSLKYCIKFWFFEFVWTLHKNIILNCSTIWRPLTWVKRCFRLKYMMGNRILITLNQYLYNFTYFTLSINRTYLFEFLKFYFLNLFFFFFIFSCKIYEK